MKSDIIVDLLAKLVNIDNTSDLKILRIIKLIYIYVQWTKLQKRKVLNQSNQIKTNTSMWWAFFYEYRSIFVKVQMYFKERDSYVKQPRNVNEPW